MTRALYDSIGGNYGDRRHPDPRIAAALIAALGDARSVVNVGAGTGSYEPSDREVIAVEPSEVMIAQRPEGSAPVVKASAEDLPFSDRSFDAALAVLTTHHWQDLGAGLGELTRVARRRVVILTCDPEAVTAWWLPHDYDPRLPVAMRRGLPPLAELSELLSGRLELRTVPIPARCTDGFVMAFWDRPELVLDRDARRATSAFARVGPEVEKKVVRALARDLDDGTWDRRHGRVRSLAEFDAGMRLLVVERPTKR
jgi:SAM-dependent methyltransferase